MTDGTSLTRAKSPAVTSWHTLLRAIALLNFVLWSLAAVTVGSRPAAGATLQWQLLFSAGYVLGCAYRSFFPVFDIPRLALVDSRLSSVLIGRSVATVAELCFAAQWALILHQLAVLTDNSLARAVSMAIVPLLTIAEVCSWHAVLSTAQRGHIFENSLWGLTAALVVVSLLAIGPDRLGDLHGSAIAWCLGGGAYVAFMFLYDVPMYWSRWHREQLDKRRYMTLAEGALDSWRRRQVSHAWEDWKHEVLWMTLYFSIGVWISISLVYASLTLG